MTGRGTEDNQCRYTGSSGGRGFALHQTGRGTRADVKLKIYEPPRFFEAFLRGRHFTEAADITARICGICPIAYQMSAVHAIERALGLRIDPAVRLLRRLFYCGEWIESHALHVYMLHAPDFLGYQDVIAMARDHPPVVEKALRLKKIGNRIMTVAWRARNTSYFGGSWGILQNAEQRAVRGTGEQSGVGAGSFAGNRAVDRGIEVSRILSRITSLWRCDMRMSIPSTRDGWCRIEVWILTRRSSKIILWSCM